MVESRDDWRVVTVNTFNSITLEKVTFDLAIFLLQ